MTHTHTHVYIHNTHAHTLIRVTGEKGGLAKSLRKRLRVEAAEQ